MPIADGPAVNQLAGLDEELETILTSFDSIHVRVSHSRLRRKPALTLKHKKQRRLQFSLQFL